MDEDFEVQKINKNVPDIVIHEPKHNIKIKNLKKKRDYNVVSVPIKQ